MPQVVILLASSVDERNTDVPPRNKVLGGTFMIKVLGDGTNVDELKTPGIYKSSTSAVTATLTGTLPEGFTYGFYVEVIGNNPYIQTLSNFSGDIICRRGFVGNAWTTWKQVMF